MDNTENTRELGGLRVRDGNVDNTRELDKSKAKISQTGAVSATAEKAKDKTRETIREKLSAFSKKISIKKEPKIADEYAAKLLAVGRPLSCIVTVTATEPNGYSAKAVRDYDETVSYRNDNGSFGYKTLTHKLIGDNEEFGMACDADGTVEVYKLIDNETYGAIRFAHARIARRIVDPIFAFTDDDSGALTVIFNLPTPAKVAEGAKARKPVTSSDDTLVVASGMPIAVKFSPQIGTVEEDDDEQKASFADIVDLARDEMQEDDDDIEYGAKPLIAPVEPLDRYVAGVIGDPNGDEPLLLVANVLLKTQEMMYNDEDDKPSFSKMFENLARDDAKNGKSSFPLGVSIAKLNEDGGEFTQVSMAGDAKYGIFSVDLEPIGSGGTNTVRIVSRDSDDDDESLENEGENFEATIDNQETMVIDTVVETTEANKPATLEVPDSVDGEEQREKENA